MLVQDVCMAFTIFVLPFHASRSDLFLLLYIMNIENLVLFFFYLVRTEVTLFSSS